MVFEELDVLDTVKYRFCLLTNKPKDFGEGVISANYEEHIYFDEYHLILVDYDRNHIPKIIEALEPEKKNRYNN